MKTTSTPLAGIILLVILFLTTESQAQSTNASPVKRPLIEEYTGAWCASCAFGSVYAEHLEKNYPNAIMVAIHSGDSMMVDYIRKYMFSYYGALPRFLMDRTDFPDNPKTTPGVSAYPWATSLDSLDYFLDKIYNQTPIASVGIEQEYDETKREITATVTATFVENASGEFRLNCFLIEDSVTGGTPYDQANSNFSGWTGAPSFLQDLVNKPTIIKGYVHNHVVREMLGSPEGISASNPTTVTKGSTYSHTFTYKVPQDYRAKNMSMVGVIQRFGPSKETDRQIVNSLYQHLEVEEAPTAVASTFDEKIVELSVYPNPVSSTVTSKLEFYVREAGSISATIVDMQGEEVSQVFSQEFNQGEYRVDLKSLHLENGLYVILLDKDGQIQSKRILIKD